MTRRSVCRPCGEAEGRLRIRQHGVPQDTKPEAEQARSQRPAMHSLAPYRPAALPVICRCDERVPGQQRAHAQQQEAGVGGVHGWAGCWRRRLERRRWRRGGGALAARPACRRSCRASLALLQALLDAWTGRWASRKTKEAKVRAPGVQRPWLRAGGQAGTIEQVTGRSTQQAIGWLGCSRAAAAARRSRTSRPSGHPSRCPGMHLDRQADSGVASGGCGHELCMA